MQIRQYIFTGNKQTKESVFLRETGKKIGDTLQNPSWSAAVWQKRLSGINLFNYVEVNILNDTVFIVVKERIYIWGLPRLAWADRNFNVWYQTKDFHRLIYGATLYWNNIGGLNHRAYFTVVNGYNQSFELGYQMPFSKHNQGWSFGLNTGYWTNHELWYVTKGNRVQFFNLANRRVQKNFKLSVTEKMRLNYFNSLELSQNYYKTSIDGAAYALNTEYLVSDTLQNEYSLKLEFISDHRNQRDYPTKGYLVRTGINMSAINLGKNDFLMESIFLRATYFKPLAAKWTLATAFFGQYVYSDEKKLPYSKARQLGYQSDYVRGYEPYVADGKGFVLGKLALRRAILGANGINLGENKVLNNYRKLPLSIWFNIFADAGHVITPLNFANTVNSLNAKWQGGVGAGFDIIAWYSAMVRMEYSVNAMKEGYFNVSFKNAF